MCITSGSTGERILADKRTSRIHVILWQERKFSKTQCAEIRDRIGRQGRNVFLEPAQPAPKGGMSGGVAIATLKSIGYSAPTILHACVADDGRLLLRHIHGLLPGGLLCGPVYCPIQRRNKGAQQHLECIQRLGRVLAKWGRPFVVGKDWNCTPDDLASTGMPARLQATLVHTRQSHSQRPGVSLSRLLFNQRRVAATDP